MSVSNVTDPNDGRNRRKVMFRSDDMHFSDLDESDTQDDDEDFNIREDAPVSEGNNDSDSEWSDSEGETEDKEDINDKSRFYGQSFGKENEIRKKIANELAKLDKINQESNIINLNEQEQGYSDGSIEYDEDSNVEDDSENEDNFKANDSDEDVDLSEVENVDKQNTNTSKVTTNDFEESNKDTIINWKTNLAQKATNAYYERQNSVANLWKLVYGK